MKKIALVLAASSAAFAMTACSEPAEEATTEEVAPVEETAAPVVEEPALEGTDVVTDAAVEAPVAEEATTDAADTAVEAAPAE